MNILFKNVPVGMSGHELAAFIETEFNQNSVDSKKLAVNVCCIEMMERQDGFCHPIEQYGIVRISPQELAKKVIRQFDGCFFKQLKLTVREYFIRSKVNDPRLNLIDTPEVFLEQRLSDRRQHTLIYSRKI
jgi:hypothetical protein